MKETNGITVQKPPAKYRRSQIDVTHKKLKLVCQKTKEYHLLISNRLTSYEQL